MLTIFATVLEARETWTEIQKTPGIRNGSRCTVSGTRGVSCCSFRFVLADVARSLPGVDRLPAARTYPGKISAAPEHSGADIRSITTHACSSCLVYQRIRIAANPASARPISIQLAKKRKTPTLPTRRTARLSFVNSKRSLNSAGITPNCPSLSQTYAKLHTSTISFPRKTNRLSN